MYYFLSNDAFILLFLTVEGLHWGAVGTVGQGMEDPILQPGIKLCPLH